MHNIDLRLFKGRFMKVMSFALFNFGTAFGSAYWLLQYLPQTPGFQKQGTHFSYPAYCLYFAIIVGTSSLPMTFLIIDDLKLNHVDLSKYTVAATTVVTIFTYVLLSVASSLETPGIYT